MVSGPSKDQAFQFALMLQAGLPAAEAILYFTETDDPHELASLLQKWVRSKAVKDATITLMGKSWQDMTLDERMKRALDLHYAQLAYLLFSSNYTEMGQVDKAKADTARQAIETKLAGLAGRGDALSRFFDDINMGKIKLTPPAPKVN